MSEVLSDRENEEISRLMSEVAESMEFETKQGSDELTEEDLMMVEGGISVPSYASFLRKAHARANSRKTRRPW